MGRLGAPVAFSIVSLRRAINQIVAERTLAKACQSCEYAMMQLKPSKSAAARRHERATSFAATRAPALSKTLLRYRVGKIVTATHRRATTAPPTTVVVPRANFSPRVIQVATSDELGSRKTTRPKDYAGKK
jgi:hypothetical protein